MNRVILTGRLTRDPEIRYSQAENSSCVARYTLAVGRISDKNTSDFIGCVAFGKAAETAEKYLRKGTKIAVEGRIQTGSFTDKDGQKHYTTDVVVERFEFCESRGTAAPQIDDTSKAEDEGFVNVPAGVDDEGLPFN